jgi:hypothetical protein
MSYIGNTPTQQNFVAGADQFSGTGSQTVFTLSRNVNTVFDIFITVANVPQDPFTAYTVAGNTLTFDGAPPSGTNNIDVVYRATNVQTFVPTPGVSTQLGLGSASAPSLTFIGDTNTGIYSPGADTVAIGTGGTERVRVVSAGDVGIGTSTPATISNRTVLSINNASNGGALNLLVNGTETLRLLTDNSSFGYVYNVANQPLVFGTNNTERMRLDASGLLAIGRTSAWDSNALLTLEKSGVAAQVINSTTNTVTLVNVANGSSSVAYSGTASNHPYYFITNGSERARIGASGGLAIANGLAVGTSTVFTSSIFFASAVLSAGAGSFPLRWNSSTGIVTYDTSSRFVKENIEDSPYGLAEVMQLQPRKYFRVDDQKFEIGFVADEIQPILPEFVPIIQKSTFTKNEEDIEAIAGGVNYEKLTAVLVKAIQELNAKVESLEAQLKGNA